MSAVPDVMLLAAGLGTRMRPLTFDMPKALVPVAGKPLLEHAIAAAAHEGHRRFVVNAHHKADQLADHVVRYAAAHPDLSLTLSREEVLLDTGGGLKKALPALSGDPVLTLNTDTFWVPGTDTPLSRMRALFEDGEADIVLLCVAPDKAFGLRTGADFLLDDDGDLGQKVGRPMVYAGAALIARAVAKTGPDGPFSLYSHFLAAQKAGRLRGVEIMAPWYHVGDPAAVTAFGTALSGPSA